MPLTYPAGTTPVPPVLQSDTFEIQRQKINNLANVVTSLTLLPTPYAMIGDAGNTSTNSISIFQPSYSVSGLSPAYNAWTTINLNALSLTSIPNGLYVQIWNADRQNGEDHGLIQYRKDITGPVYTAQTVGWSGSGADTAKSLMAFVPVSIISNPTYGSFQYYRTTNGSGVNSWGISILGFY